jgi:GT2 family glycosyltransferase
MIPSVSVVIPSYNPKTSLLRELYDSLLSQSLGDFEVILVDDASSDVSAYACIQDKRFRILYQGRNHGPAACRNRGARAAESEFLFFTDTDCVLDPDALKQVVDNLYGGAIVMGNTITRVRTPFGRAVALLGFPGGGILGFDKVWRVDEEGYTNSFSSCALAFRKVVFETLGEFDETFPVAGGEDTVLARQAVLAGCRIRYVPAIRVFHVEKGDLCGFLRWQLTRGRGNYHIKKRVDKVGGYLKLRFWTFKNSLRAAGPRYFLPVGALIVLSVAFQLTGMLLEARRINHHPHKS